MAPRQTHHKHSSTKGYRRLLDRLADHPDVHRVATGRVTPRMGAGRPVAPISKVRTVSSGLSITINMDGAIIDAYVVTDRPDAVAEFMAQQGWTRRERAACARALARGVGRAARATGHGGTSLPGKVMLRLDRGALARLAAGLPEGTVLVSATNGKTTTAALAASILERAGTATVHNVAGANMAGGVVSALLERPPAARLGLFEVDEFWLGELADALAPRAIVLGNLFRDQLDRYGELESIGERWAALARRAGARLVLNADDPLIADLGRGVEGTLYFGVEDPAAADGTALAHASDSTRCRRCGAAYAYRHVYLAHLGVYACPSCGQQRPAPDVHARAIALDGLRGARFELHTPAGHAEVRTTLPGLYNVYNALGAAALATALGIDLDTIVEGLGAAGAVFGRGERVTSASASCRSS